MDRAEQAALEEVAAHAGVEVSDGEEPELGSELAAGAEAPPTGEWSDERTTETPVEGGFGDHATATDGDATAGEDAALEIESATETDRAAVSAASDAGEPGNGDDSEADDASDAVDSDDADPGTPLASQLDDPRFAALIEALLFASDRPLTIQRLRQLTRVSDLGRIQAALTRITERYADGGIVLSLISGGYSFRTHAAYSAWVQQLIQGRPVRLSRAQLETLAIVAYRQPITRPEIDQIRGVDSGATLKLLLDRQLIRILGKREEVGRPLLYGTTREFLDFFSLNDLRELPTLREYSELSEESRSVVEKLGHTPPPVAVATGDDASGASPSEATDHDPSQGESMPAPEVDLDAPTTAAAPPDLADAAESPQVEPEVPLAPEPAPPDLPPSADGTLDRSRNAVLDSPDPDSFDSTGEHTLV